MSRMPNQKLVLVVDDDPAMLKCAKRLLRQHAYETILFIGSVAASSMANGIRTHRAIISSSKRRGGRQFQNRLHAKGHASVERQQR